MYIYKVTNKINGMVYIGQTNRSIWKRWEEHCKPALKTRSYLSAAIQKYGKDNFSVEILNDAWSQIQLNKLEKHYIQLHGAMSPNGYNLRGGGAGGVHSEETKVKIGAANKGKKLSQETKDKVWATRRLNKKPYFSLDSAKCSKCMKWKNKEEFNKNGSRVSGVQSQCKECRVKYRPDK